MIKKVYGVFFSGTGTTEKIVTNLATDLGNKLNVPIEFYNFTVLENRKSDLNFTEEDLVVLGTPVIAGRVPNLLLKFLAKVQGNGALGIPVVLYGNRNFDDALIELRNIMRDNNFKPIAGGAFIGEHSFSTILGANRPDEKDMNILFNFSEDIYNKITSSDFDPSILVTVKGEDPLRYYYQPRDSKGVPVDIRKVKPVTNMELCNNCNLCVEICPLGSINPDDVSDIFGICMKCCGCIKKCPNSAKYFDDANYLYHQHELEEEFARRAEPEVFTK